MSGTAARICARCGGHSDARIGLGLSPVCTVCYDGASTTVGSDPLPRLIARLEERGCRGRGANWECPAHDDDHPSLSVARGRNGGVVLHRHTGCLTEDVLAALELTWADLFAAESRIESTGRRPDVAQLERQHRAGQLRPERVVLGPLPDEAPGASVEDMRRIAEDMRLLFGLHRAVGEFRPMPYSARFAAGRMGWPNGHRRSNKVICALVKAHTIDRLPDLQPSRGQPRGTAVYAPPLRAIAADGTDEFETVPVESAEGQPPVEVVDQVTVHGAQSVGREHVGMVATGDMTPTGNGPVAGGARTTLDVVHDHNDSPARGVLTRDAVGEAISDPPQIEEASGPSEVTQEWEFEKHQPEPDEGFTVAKSSKSKFAGLHVREIVADEKGRELLIAEAKRVSDPAKREQLLPWLSWHAGRELTLDDL